MATRQPSQQQPRRGSTGAGDGGTGSGTGSLSASRVDLGIQSQAPTAGVPNPWAVDPHGSMAC